MAQTKTRLFEVKQPIISEFFNAVEENDLYCELHELVDHETLTVKVYYEPDERDQVMNLIELLDEYEQHDSEDDETDDE